MEKTTALTQSEQTPPAPQPISQSGAGFNTSGVVTMALAHGFHDIYTAFLAPLLPLIIQNLAITKTAAGLLSVFYNLPSLLQPVIGLLGDRVNLRLLVVLAPAVSAAMMTLIGIAPSYGWLIVILITAGFSSAGLHAIGPVIGGLLSGKQLGRGMSFWMVGGELGRTAGPLVVVAAVSAFGLGGLPWLMVGGIIASIILYFVLGNAPDYRPATDQRIDVASALRKLRPLLVPLSAVIATRALLFSAITTFLPTFLIEEGASLWLAGASLSVLQAAGVVGAMGGGVVSDRFGRRRVMIAMTLAAPLFVLLFLQVRGWLQFPVLLLCGLTLLSTTPVMMAMTQERAPKSRALANGVFMALNFVISSLAILAVGMLGDHFGLRSALTTSAVTMLVGMPFAFLLPDKSR